MTISKYSQSYGWGVDEAKDAEQYETLKLERARLNAIPEYRKHLDDGTWLCRLLPDLLYVDAHEFYVPPFREQSLRRKHLIDPIGMESKKPSAYAGDVESPEYIYFKEERRAFSSALSRYVISFRTSQWDKRPRDRLKAASYLGVHALEILRQGFRRAADPYDVGSSLYLYQQMYDRKLSTSPALSRAAWLVKNAPLRKPVPEKPIPRAKWQCIQEHWSVHFNDSHFWAALVATMKSPLLFNENLLFDFVCDVDVDQFKRLSNTFLDFRKRVAIPKVSAKPMSLKRGLAGLELDPIGLLSSEDVLNPLEDFQWDALKKYPTKARGAD